MKIEERVERLEKKVDKIVVMLDTFIGKETPVRSYDDHEFTKEESAREFFLKFSPKNDTEKTLVAINFLEKKGLQSITVKEIEDALKEMREPLPTNIADKIQMLARKALVMKTGQEGRRKCWLITNTGAERLRGMRKDAK